MIHTHFGHHCVLITDDLKPSVQCTEAARNRVHTTPSLQKVITFYDYFSQKNYDFFMTSAIFLCCGLMFSNDVTH